MSKAKELLPKIIGATNNKQAVEVLHLLLESLYLTNDYTDIVKLKDKLTDYKDNYRTITDTYEQSKRTIEDMLNCRTNLNFLYRDTSDAMSFDVNRLKIFYEEAKTSVRGESLKNLKEDKAIQETFNAKSTSALRDIVGISGKYQEYIANYSISYGLYKDLEALLNSIRMFLDLLSSAIKNEQLILQKDIK